MESGASQFVAFLLGLAVTAGILVPVLLRLRTSASDALAQKTEAARGLERLERSHTAVEEDLRFLTQFLNEYPRLTREFYGGLTARQIAGTLLSIIRRSLDPQQVAVLVMSPEGGSDRAKAPRLVVAAAYPDGTAFKAGSEVPLEAGEIGFAAEAQIVVSRQDLQTETARSRIRPGAALAGMPQPDLIAPLVFDQETLGIIVVAGPRRSGDLKVALRLLAQAGAQALHTASQVSRMRTTAEKDGLTWTYNKKHMEHTLGQLVYRAACEAYDGQVAGRARAVQALAVFLFDIDNFKAYNDANGHLAGDRLLQELAEIVGKSVRRDDIFGRFGGEEFLLVMPNTSAAQGMEVAEKIRALIASHPFPFADRQPLGCVSISGGVSQYPVHGLDPTGLLQAADEALYDAKRGGRNRVLPAQVAAPVRA